MNTVLDRLKTAAMPDRTADAGLAIFEEQDHTTPDPGTTIDAPYEISVNNDTAQYSAVAEKAIGNEHNADMVPLLDESSEGHDVDIATLQAQDPYYEYRETQALLNVPAEEPHKSLGRKMLERTGKVARAAFNAPNYLANLLHTNAVTTLEGLKRQDEGTKAAATFMGTAAIGHLGYKLLSGALQHKGVHLPDILPDADFDSNASASTGNTAPTTPVEGYSDISATEHLGAASQEIATVDGDHLKPDAGESTWSTTEDAIRKQAEAAGLNPDKAVTPDLMENAMKAFTHDDRNDGKFFDKTGIHEGASYATGDRDAIIQAGLHDENGHISNGEYKAALANDAPREVPVPSSVAPEHEATPLDVPDSVPPTSAETIIPAPVTDEAPVAVIPEVTDAPVAETPNMPNSEEDYTTESVLTAAGAVALGGVITTHVIASKKSAHSNDIQLTTAKWDDLPNLPENILVGTIESPGNKRYGPKALVPAGTLEQSDDDDEEDADA